MSTAPPAGRPAGRKHSMHRRAVAMGSQRQFLKARARRLRFVDLRRTADLSRVPAGDVATSSYDSPPYIMLSSTAWNRLTIPIMDRTGGTARKGYLLPATSKSTPFRLLDRS